MSSQPYDPMRDRLENTWRCFLPSFRGRMSLSHYLRWREIVYITMFAVAVSEVVLSRILHFWVSNNTIMLSLILAGFILLYLFTLLVSVHVRRLHDVGLTAYWVFNPFFIIMLGRLGLSAPGEPGSNKWGKNTEELLQSTSSAPLSPMARGQLKQIYRAAARGTDPAAKLELGRCYFHGCGMVQNRVLAFYWISKALDEKCPAALEFINNLSSECKNG